ncbi:tripartite tricarboxylate transporter TctB family protein [Aurantimonas marina]|uniref:tripartite tricarboxylate transporter TctB family protein n=1 Tax=Aurantimonas marina TaxID=2780508 RepID=UPI0019D04313|nr:tripartite tricarboxylate transporter TctB family protein [Aurantimonas marina]
MAALRKPHDLPGTIAAALFIGLGVVLILQTGRMTPMGSVFPITIAAAMIVFSAILILRNFVIAARRPSVEAADETARETDQTRGSMPRRIGFLVAMAAWVALIPILGFFVASLIAFFAIMAVASHERVTPREGIMLGVMGIVILTGFYLIMANVLLIPMPRGIFF